MTGTITKDNLFRPSGSKAETKAEITNHTARAIIAAEAELRDAKTARLRQARLASEAVAAPPVLPKRKRGKAAGQPANPTSNG